MRSIFILFQLLLSVSLFAQEKLTITPLTGNFYIYTTYNVYKDMVVPSNGMYLVTSEGIVVFDSPWDTTQFQPFLDSMKIKHDKKVIMCIATHSHEDRTGALAFFRKHGIKTYTNRLTDELSIKGNKHRAEFLFDKDTTFSIGGYIFQTYYGGKGHAPDNIVIWFEKEKILYGGCLIKSTEAVDLGYTGDADIPEWKNTILRIKKKFKPKYIIPGHQDWSSNRSLDHTLKLLKYSK